MQASSQAACLSRRGALSSAVALTVLPRSLPARARTQAFTAVPLADLPMQRYVTCCNSDAITTHSITVQACDMVWSASQLGAFPLQCLCRIKLPKGGVGRDYVLIQLTINDEGPYDFMLDSGRHCDEGWI